MVDRVFTEPRLAALYDRFSNSWNGERGDFGFYLPRVMAARSVLDVGCGTGELLRLARAAGHSGRLCGLDPAEAMLVEARARSDVEWVLGDLSSTRWDAEFDLVVMSGHAFQVFVDDAELQVALAAIRAALTDDGRFGFETRNPSARAWERWTPAHAAEITDASGAVVRMAHSAETPVQGDVVRFTATFTSAGWAKPLESRSTLRFLDAPAVDAFLGEAGLVVEERYGDWDGSPLTATSPEIITVARPDVRR